MRKINSIKFREIGFSVFLISALISLISMLFTLEFVPKILIVGYSFFILGFFTDCILLNRKDQNEKNKFN